MIVPCSQCSKPNRVPAGRLADKARCAVCKTALLPLARPVPVATAEDFDELVRDAPLPVLVDFWAAWCGPCRMVAPELEKLARERVGRVVIAKVDTDALGAIAGRFDVQSIPTLIVFRAGRQAERWSGALSAAEIARRLAV